MGFLSQALLRLELFEMDRPTSLEQCYIQGSTRICSTKLAAYNSYLFDEAIILTKRHGDDENEYEEPKVKKSRKRMKSVMEYLDNKGERQPLLPADTIWYKCYVQGPVRSPKFEAIFRRRFRLPYDSFLALVQDAKDGKWFPRWDDIHAKGGKKAAPLALLILASLRYLGRGWTFDDLTESTAISISVLWDFFHAFITIGSTILYQKYVVAPTKSLLQQTSKRLTAT
jgi:hypothetical protein